MKLLFVAGLVLCAASAAWAQCNPTSTVISGTHAPGNICSGQLIFEDNFDNLDLAKWRHENTLAGGGNWEFQWYVNDRFNSYTAGGILHLKPSFTSDVFGEAFLSSGRVIIPENECTQTYHYGCDRQGTPEHIINPIRSAAVSTWNSFRFRFGVLEFRAKNPAGDWLWPALWLMPRDSVYGDWPRSGEIDVMESRGNRNFYEPNSGANLGAEQAASAIHFGPSAEYKNPWDMGHNSRNRVPRWDEGFHTYRLVWTPNSLEFLYDNELILNIPADNGFWAKGGFTGANPWAGASNMAPFDQEFYIIMNLAVGGMTGFFNDGWNNQPNGKPW